MTFKFSLDTGEVLDYPIRSAFQNFYPSYAEKHFVSDEQAKAAAYISNCKTGRLGYTVSVCPECGFKKIRRCSCNNRDCPCSQVPLEKKWVMERNSELIPGIAYYHVVFTLPHELNPLILVNRKALYDLLFSAASASLIDLCRDKKFMGATPGIVSVLHTWGQQLSFHPHLHVCLSGGGLTADGKFIESRHKGFIIPKPVLGTLFRGNSFPGLSAFMDPATFLLMVTHHRSGIPIGGRNSSIVFIPLTGSHSSRRPSTATATRWNTSPAMLTVLPSVTHVWKMSAPKAFCSAIRIMRITTRRNSFPFPEMSLSGAFSSISSRRAFTGSALQAS